jgi:hypothetical protein
MDKIDWLRQKRAVVEPVFARGNEQEKNEIIRFYGEGLQGRFCFIGNSEQEAVK